MDPLSVAASVTGILATAAHATTILTSFIKNTRSAPKLAHRVLTEVSSFAAVLSQLQAFVLGSASVARERGTLILVEQVLVVLTECVIAFSELDEVLQTLKTQQQMELWDRMKWAINESKITGIMGRLQGNKTSLTLMLTILQWYDYPFYVKLNTPLTNSGLSKTTKEAERSQETLFAIVEQILASNQEMCRRLRGLEEASKSLPVTDTPLLDNDPGKGVIASTHSSSEGAHRVTKLEIIRKPVQGTSAGFAFEEDLKHSQVYKRALFSRSGASLVTSASRTTASSVLSGLSISDVSRISVLALPIYSTEISNPDRYDFGDFSIGTFQDPIGDALDKTRGGSPFSRLKNFSNVLRKGSSIPNSEEKEPIGKKILGVPLEISIRYANVAISLTSENGESFIYGYIPIYIAKIGVFLKGVGEASPTKHGCHTQRCSF
jgi:hypothetical protein